MPAAVKTDGRTHPHSSFVSLLSGWVQQGVQSFLATQRILLDMAMRQNASVVQALRQQLSHPQHSPANILTEMAGEGMSNFIEAQKVLLDLAQQQNTIMMSGVKERIGSSPAAIAMADLLRRSVDTFIDMQHEFLTIASKQTHGWMHAAKAGKPFQGEELVEFAREGMENFVRTQKKFLDVISEETAKATGSKRTHEGVRKIKKTELAELAHKASEAFIDAQKKLFDVAGRQMNANVKAMGQTTELLNPFPFVPLAELTREGVKSYVDAQKALMDVMFKSHNGHKHEAKPVRRHMKRPARPARKEPAEAAHAVA
ncbi:MAG TPA: hypothetical protein VEV41_15655 [Terriglobales bacterium]|nr:hypothetical protein [Terriglobales bacterium]